MPKPILYVFGPSVWASVPDLAILELGYQSEIERKVVNLTKGENFAPWFLEKNAKATLPTLEADGNVYPDTTSATAYIIKHSSSSLKPGSSLIALIHDDKYDPNFAKIALRSDEELEAKIDGPSSAFLASRQEALDKWSLSPGAAEFKPFYDSKKKSNGGILEIYENKSLSHAKEVYFKKSAAFWTEIRTLLFEILPNSLPDSGFIGGRKPGEDDFHVGGWLARIVSVCGGVTSEDGLEALGKEFGEVPKKLESYWKAWSGRDSWKEVYVDGLH